MTNIYKNVLGFKNKYSNNIGFRLDKHSEVVENHLKPDEKIIYTFYGNAFNLPFISTCVVVVTDKRILIGHKNLLFGERFTSVDLKRFNDLKVNKGIIWGSIVIDTFKEQIEVYGIDPDSRYEIGDVITKTVANANNIKNENIENNVKSQEQTINRDSNKEIQNVNNQYCEEELLQVSLKQHRIIDGLLREKYSSTTDKNEREKIKRKIWENYLEYKKLLNRSKQQPLVLSKTNNNRK